MSEKIDYSKGIYDARQLGTGRMLILGVQHMFAMFGATVLVPLLTGLSVSTTLLCAGLGTLLFHLVTRGKVPAFLGSSFAYLGGFSIVAPMLADANGNLTVANTKMLPYACAGVAFSGILYLVVSLLISTFGIRRIMKFFPPVVTGPIIISIGLILAPSAITNCESNWLLAFVALGTVIVCNIWGKGMVKILPILIGVLVSYAVALVTGAVDFQKIADAAWFGIPLHKEAMNETMTQLYRRGLTVVSTRRGYGLYFTKGDTLQFLELQADNDHCADQLLQAAREKTGAANARILLAENQTLYLGSGRRCGYGMIAFLGRPFSVTDAYFRMLL